MNIKKYNLSKGFTLVELLVVIAIIGILAATILAQIGTARAKARDAKRVQDVNQLLVALELYNDDNGRYPSTLGSGVGGLTNDTKYLTKLPVDPKNTEPFTYHYGVDANGVKFQVSANLELKNKALDSDADFTAGEITGLGAGARDGTLETCDDLAAAKCVFDLGQK